MDQIRQISEKNEQNSDIFLSSCFTSEYKTERGKFQPVLISVSLNFSDLVDNEIAEQQNLN